jgi:hypothetical protein
MTTAVCFKCGRLKFGAIVACPRCGTMPRSEDEVIRSVWMSDHHFSDVELAQMGSQIAAGNVPQPDAQTRKQLLDGMREAQELAPAMAAGLGIAPSRGGGGGGESISLERARAIPDFRRVLEGISEEEWMRASGDPMAMTALLVRKEAEKAGRGRPSAAGARRRGGWWRLPLLVIGVFVVVVNTAVFATSCHQAGTLDRSFRHDSERRSAYDAMTSSGVVGAFGVAMVLLALYRRR